MKFLRRIAAPIAALGMITAMSTISAQAAELTPDKVAGDTPQSVIKVGTNTNVTPAWREKVNGDRIVEMWATSPAMDNREVPLIVLKAPEPNRPTIYLLNGGDGGEGRANWVAQTDVLDFYKDKNVNVVIPMAGKFSYYTDWVSEAPSLGGKQMWETFLTKELPGPLERELQANNKRAIAGMSMSATTSLLFAEHQPGFYDAIGSFSGCAATSSPVPMTFIEATINRGDATGTQMWGPAGSPTWIYNDALINSEKLRGTEMYISNASGLAGEYEMPSHPRFREYPDVAVSIGVAKLTVEGGAIEAATNQCTHDLKAKLDSQGIPADFNFRPTGTHSWPYWQQDLRDSWPTFERAFNK